MRADEWLVPAGEGRNLTRDEMREALSADPEVTLISDFLAGELSPDEALAVEARLRDDEAFRRHVTPVIEAWKAWPSSRDVAVPEHELAASWQRFLAKAAWKREGAQATSVQRPADPPRDTRAPYRVRRWQLAVRFGVRGGFALLCHFTALCRRLLQPQPLLHAHASRSQTRSETFQIDQDLKAGNELRDRQGSHDHAAPRHGLQIPGRRELQQGLARRRA